MKNQIKFKSFRGRVHETQNEMKFRFAMRKILFILIFIAGKLK